MNSISLYISTALVVNHSPSISASGFLTVNRRSPTFNVSFGFTPSFLYFFMRLDFRGLFFDLLVEAGLFASATFRWILKRLALLGSESGRYYIFYQKVKK